MDSNMQIKVNRLNELFAKIESGQQLNNSELNEQAILRDELINYFKFTLEKIKRDKK